MIHGTTISSFKMAAVLHLSTLLFFVALTAFAHADQKDTEVAMVVQGIVYCQRCAVVGSNSLAMARPLLGAKVAITCRDYKNRVRFYSVAPVDHTGYFYAPLNSINTRARHISQPEEACKVQLVSSGDMTCNRLTNVNQGIRGSNIQFETKLYNGTSFETNLYTTLPLAFSPSHCLPRVFSNIHFSFE